MGYDALERPWALARAAWSGNPAVGSSPEFIRKFRRRPVSLVPLPATRLWGCPRVPPLIPFQASLRGGRDVRRFQLVDRWFRLRCTVPAGGALRPSCRRPRASSGTRGGPGLGLCPREAGPRPLRPRGRCVCRWRRSHLGHGQRRRHDDCPPHPDHQGHRLCHHASCRPDQCVRRSLHLGHQGRSAGQGSRSWHCRDRFVLHRRRRRFRRGQGRGCGHQGGCDHHQCGRQRCCGGREDGDGRRQALLWA